MECLRQHQVKYSLQFQLIICDYIGQHLGEYPKYFFSPVMSTSEPNSAKSPKRFLLANSLFFKMWFQPTLCCQVKILRLQKNHSQPSNNETRRFNKKKNSLSLTGLFLFVAVACLTGPNILNKNTTVLYLNSTKLGPSGYFKSTVLHVCRCSFHYVQLHFRCELPGCLNPLPNLSFLTGKYRFS